TGQPAISTWSAHPAYPAYHCCPACAKAPLFLRFRHGIIRPSFHPLYPGTEGQAARHTGIAARLAPRPEQGKGAMLPTASIFLDFSLPNAATWFYFALLLAVAVFVRFSRPLSLRNWDVVAMFLLVPGLLLRQEATAAPVAEAGKLPAPTSEE